MRCRMLLGMLLFMTCVFAIAPLTQTHARARAKTAAAAGAPKASTAPPTAEPRADSKADGKAGDEVLAAEQARADALTRNDYKALDKLLGDDLVYVHSGGRVDGKKAFMAPLLTGDNHYIRMEKKTATVHVVGNLAVIYGNFLVQTQGAAGTPPRELEDAILTLVYEKRDGRWQMISYQSTRKAPDAPAAK